MVFLLMIIVITNKIVEVVVATDIIIEPGVNLA
jgi:hypothetical protein